MIKTTEMLVQELNHYANPTAKIRRMVKDGVLFPVTRGSYETDREIPGYCLAPIIYGPSYLSFEFALSNHGLIPEAVRVFTSATFEKRRSKRYETPFGIYTYRDIPRRSSIFQRFSRFLQRNSNPTDFSSIWKPKRSHTILIFTPLF